MPEDFIVYDAYRKLAEKYAEIIDFKPHNADYERPALLELIPDVEGKLVLDAGCGTGSLTKWLLDKGAEVIGVDASPHMLSYAEKRVGEDARLVEHNLELPLDFLGTNSFDIVVSSLVMHYIKNLNSLFMEFYRIIKPGGSMVFSFGHPFADFYYHPSENYYEVKLISYDWTGFTDEPVTVPCYRRPLCGYTEALASSGFTIERLTEPLPNEKFRQKLPENYAKHLSLPLFMVIKARAKLSH